MLIISQIYFNEISLAPWEKEYYLYIANIAKQVLEILNNKINIIIGKGNYHFNNKNKILRIKINFEHTLVVAHKYYKNDVPIGTIKYDNKNNYLVRIDKYQCLNKSDIVIDYSLPNIHNIVESKLFPILSKKIIYLAPNIYSNYYFTQNNRDVDSLTTFIIMNERRKILINRLRKNHKNVNNSFDKDSLQKLLRRTKVLINIHQTDHHHTFEELRVLPALQCGVIVVAEMSPLKKIIPYNDYIIWANFDQISEIVEKVLINYDHYFESIFKTPKKIKLNELTNQNINSLFTIIQSILEI